jgi:hypothetical protein
MFEFLCICAYAVIVSIVFYPMYLGAKEEIERAERLKRRRNK